MRPNFDRIADVMWNQLKHVVPLLVKGAKLTSPEFFGDAIPAGSMSSYRRILLDAEILGVDSVTKKLVIGRPDDAMAMVASSMNVAKVLWPEEAEEWQAQMAHAADLKKKQAQRPTIQVVKEAVLESLMKAIPEQPIIPSKDFVDPSAARWALRMNRIRALEAPPKAAEPSPPVVEEPKAPEPVPEPPPPAVEETPAPEPEPDPAPAPPPASEEDDLVAVEMAKLKLMHATAENMVYIRDRLDALIKRNAQQAPPAAKAVEVVKVPVLPKEIPVVLTVVNAEQIDSRFEALEQQLNEVLTILRTLM